MDVEETVRIVTAPDARAGDRPTGNLEPLDESKVTEPGRISILHCSGVRTGPLTSLKEEAKDQQTGHTQSSDDFEPNPNYILLSSQSHSEG